MPQHFFNRLHSSKMIMKVEKILMTYTLKKEEDISTLMCQQRRDREWKKRSVTVELLKTKLFLLYHFFLRWCDVRNISTNTYHEYFHSHR